MLDFETQIKPYLLGASKKEFPKELLHPYYEQSKKVKSNISETFADIYPGFLDKNRPKEKKEYKAYRQDIFKNLVLPFRTKVRNQFNSIRNAEDFYIHFPDTKKVDEKDTLEYYCEKEFGMHKSVSNWVWNEWLPLFLQDPNAVGVILPVETDNPNKFRDVRGLFIPCENVIMFAQGRFAVLKSLEKSTYIDSNGKIKKDGIILYFFDHDSYSIATQISEIREGGTLSSQFYLLGIETLQTEENTVAYFKFPEHYSPEFPVFNVGMIVKESQEFGKYNLYDTIIADAIPHLQTAMQRANDKEISALHHTALREWQYTQKKCSCENGKVQKELLDADNNFLMYAQENCPKCGGSGYTAFVDSLEIMLVTPPDPSGFDDDKKPAAMPTPPGGYIEGSIEPLKAFREEFEYEIRDAYKALGMEHLNESPLVQSGVSKKYDRGELSQLLTNVSRFIKEEIFDTVFTCIDSIRYGFLANLASSCHKCHAQSDLT
ncbi:hypothetical protein ACFFJX_12620 [Pseudarcicella hirudinis]|uniref:hypothetical protein n=1 Tax=Pseudarcicella hirudinis TaxID=1079859 RepID=UPI0035E7FF2C